MGKKFVLLIFCYFIIFACAPQQEIKETTQPPVEIRLGKTARLPQSFQPLKVIGKAGKGREEFISPGEIEFDAQGDFYVLDRGNKRVKKFNSDGEFLLEFDIIDPEVGYQVEPDGIAIDKSYRIYITDRENSSILIYDVKGALGGGATGMTGSYLGKWKKPEGANLERPGGIEIDYLGNVYVIDNAQDTVKVFNSFGNFKYQFGGFGQGIGQLNKPNDIAIDNKRNIYICDTQNNRIVKFDFNGNYILDWGKKGSNPGEFDSPNAISLDAWDNIFVLDSGNKRLQIFLPTGEFILEYKLTDGQFLPQGIGIDQSFCVISDSFNNCIILLRINYKQQDESK